MSFRGGRGGGGFRGGRGRGGGGGFRGGRGGGNFRQDLGPPDQVVPLGYFTHTSQDDLVVKSELKEVPFFNAPIYLENKTQIGKIDEIFGTMTDYMVSVKLSDDVKTTSFKFKDKLYIDPAKLLPISRFLPKPPEAKTPGAKRRGGGGGGGRGFGGRGGGGRGFKSGGGGRGGFGGRGGGGRNSFGGGGGRNNFGGGGGGGRNSYGGGGGGRRW